MNATNPGKQTARQESYSGAPPLMTPAFEPAAAVRLRRVLVIHNPVAGWRKRRRLKAALAAMSAQGLVSELVLTNGPGDAACLAQAVEPELDAVFVAGGDGTINEAINGLLGCGRPPPPLGVLPLGTANVLANELGLPEDPVAAAAVLAQGRVMPVRLGRANGRYFVMMAGIGFDARIVAFLDRRLKRGLGKGAYAVEMLRRLAVDRPYRLRAEIDGRPVEAGSLIVANGHFYGGRFVLAPQARLTEPRLHVCVFERPGRWATARYVLATGLGRLHRLGDYRVIPAERITVDGLPGEPVQADGELITGLPVEIGMAPIPLPVLVPPLRA